MKQIHSSKRAKMTGKGAGASFVAIPHFVLNSPQFAALSGTEVKMLLELARQYNGSNNGAFCSPHTQADRGWRKATALGALYELEDAGWIATTHQGGRRLGCSLYAITWWAIDECPGKHSLPAERKPSHHWKMIRAVRKAYPTGTESVPKMALGTEGGL